MPNKTKVQTDLFAGEEGNAAEDVEVMEPGELSFVGKKQQQVDQPGDGADTCLVQMAAPASHDVDPLSNATIWAANFSFGPILACDSRATSLIGGRRQKNDKFQKFFHITDDIILAAAGRTRIAKLAIGTVRNLVRDFVGRIKLEDLVATFRQKESSEEVFATLIRNLNRENDADGLGCKLLLSSCRKGSFFTPDITVALIDIKEVITYKSERLMENNKKEKPCGLGCGSGFDTASRILNDLTYNSDLEEVKDAAKRAFQEAAEKDDCTGGVLVIFRGTWGGCWSLLEHHPLY